MLRKTKICCTLGPTTSSHETIEKLLKNGMNICRLNFSHRKEGFDFYENLFGEIDILRQDDKYLFGVAMDTKGPETRVKKIVNGSVEIQEGCVVQFNFDMNGPSVYIDKKQHEKLLFEKNMTNMTRFPNQEDGKIESKLNNQKKTRNKSEKKSMQTNEFNSSDFNVSKLKTNVTIDVDFKIVDTELPINYQFSLDDSFLKMKMLSIDKKCIVAEALNNHVLMSNKSINLPGTIFEGSYLSTADKEDIDFCVSKGIDFIFASFVNTQRDVIELRNYVQLSVSRSPVPVSEPLIISKIESYNGIRNLDNIIAESDGIMIARGDLGCEYNIYDLFKLQCVISERCIALNKPFIVATQMIESMCDNIVPTRAEIVDIGNAVASFSDVVMTSKETALGKYYSECVTLMRNACLSAEKYLKETKKMCKCFCQAENVEQEQIDSFYLSTLNAIFKGGNDFSLSNNKKKIICCGTIDQKKNFDEAKSTRLEAFVFIKPTYCDLDMYSLAKTHTPLIAISDCADFLRKLNLRRGVLPFKADKIGDNINGIIDEITKNLQEHFKLQTCNFLFLWCNENGQFIYKSTF
ncbi:pyruvate kinase [Edhazardia aedis USNM 41457]|uniref:pyruvate kinase n=1 Tax=Edhazardia aedis (strain USNM 41457) TaxID=1003232 RepID=J9D9J6_EDHAE|nr:pyruvate kinase [Edhazardia aedis USNM 41457]|eukprot:EJW04441.1 pyruvate kinase [Edhazardia aedis USNM 41457]